MAGVLVQETVASTLKSSSAVVLDAPSIGLNGAVKLPLLIAGQIQAESYSTGVLGNLYKKATHNIEDGSGDDGGNTPDLGSGGSSNRHCAAWEQVNEAFNLVCDMLVCCCEKLGCDDLTDQVRSLAEEAIMNRNRGE
jgi:hypothetical protein